MRTQLYDQVSAQFRKGSDAFAKLHGLPRVTAPVFAVKNLVRRHDAARHVAHQSHGRRRGRNSLLIRFFQRIQRGFHQNAVERLIPAERPYVNLFGLETLRYRLNCLYGAADDLMNAVVNGDAQGRAVG